MTMIPIQSRLKVASAPIMQALHQFGCELRCSIPATVIAFDSVRQVVSVQPAIQEVMRVNGVAQNVTLPILDDVPIGLPCAGGWSLTFPITVGDECDLVFSDMAFDNWWQNGGVQTQPSGHHYRHDIGDAKAWFGLRNQTRVLANYSTTSAQLRSDDGAIVLDMARAGATLTAPLTQIVAPGGTPQTLVTSAWMTWYEANIQPFLVAKGYAGPLQPSNSLTTVLEAQ